ncbi:MAG TPA: transcriptional repressor LexA [Dehalococcoidia bacterium]|nr:transcriptional repressor LexA [Dehalococcoidia bacterium]
MKTKQLSPKQRSILAFMRDFVDENSYPPSIRDILGGCGISSTSVVDYNLRALERLGYIRRDREVSRAIELLDGKGKRSKVVSIPVVGQIAAGAPIPVPGSGAVDDPDDTVEVSEDVTHGRADVFAVRVKGTSMIDALVGDGDLVLLRAAETAENGEMVAVWLKRENETTLKYLYREGSRVRLQPANSTMQPIYTDAANVAVQGKVISVIRTV